MVGDAWFNWYKYFNLFLIQGWLFSCYLLFLDYDPLEDISTVVANRRREEATIDVKSQGSVRFSIWVSFVEIYNEQMFDLLAPLSSKKKMTKRTMLQLKEDGHGQPYVKGVFLFGHQHQCSKWSYANHMSKVCFFLCTNISAPSGLVPTICQRCVSFWAPTLVLPVVLCQPYVKGVFLFGHQH